MSRRSDKKYRMKQQTDIKIRVVVSIFAIAIINGLQHTLSPVLSSISDHYPYISVSMIQMLVTVPMLIAIVFALLTGWVALYVSKKKIFIFAGIVSFVTGLMPLMNDSFYLLFVSRGLYGISLGIVVSLVTALVADFFEGDERVQVMGIQGASVGTGMVVVTTLSGIVGESDFHRVYFLGILGLVCAIVIAVLLPDRPVEKVREGERKTIRLNGRVWTIAAFLFAEGFFIIIFATNVAMHLGGALKGNTVVAGTITGVFSGSQIVMGLLLGRITRIMKGFTGPVAMLAMGAGFMIMSFASESIPMLVMSAILCGYSQSVYCAGAMAEVTTVVDPESTPMAASLLTVALCVSQFISPVAMNGVCTLFYGERTTSGVYFLGGIGITIVAILAFVWKSGAFAKKDQPA